MSTRRTGYTLIELVVVLVILAIAGAVAVPAFATLRPSHAEDSAAASLVGALRLARERAVASGRDAQLIVDAAGARAWLRPRDTTFVLPLPDGCQFEGAPRTVMRIAPDGAAFGAMPTVRCGARRMRVDVDPLTGTPTVKVTP
jgi:prepilin-type N-terminal cleavage/methylation domain-containing protein